uniref:Ovule protein n=1 Tax=Brugia timori TaxID=42155 RepID=A0A0R3QRD0_9BILA
LLNHTLYFISFLHSKELNSRREDASLSFDTCLSNVLCHGWRCVLCQTSGVVRRLIAAEIVVNEICLRLNCLR